MKRDPSNFQLTNELIAQYVDGLLPQEEKEQFEAYLAAHPEARDMIDVQMEIAQSLGEGEMEEVPDYVTERARRLITENADINCFDILVKLSQDAFESIVSSAEIFLTGSPTPVPIYRGAEAPSQTVKIRRYYRNFNVEITLENPESNQCAVMVNILHATLEPKLESYRVLLVQDNYEVESYLTEQGTARFESVPAGEYCIEIMKSNHLCGKIFLQLEAPA